MEDFAGKKTAILKGPVVAAEPYGPWQTFPEVEELVISEEVRLFQNKKASSRRMR